MAKWEDDLVFVDLDLNEEDDQRALHCLCKSDYNFHIYDQKYLERFLGCLNSIVNTKKENFNSFEFDCSEFSVTYHKTHFLFDFVRCSLALKINYEMIKSLQKGISNVMENQTLDSS